MARQSRQAWILKVGAPVGEPVALVVLLAVIWAAAPEDLRGPLMLVGGMFAAVTYLVLYAVQRRRHW